MMNKHKGASLIEYALIAALIAVVSIVAIRALGIRAQRIAMVNYAAMKCTSNEGKLKSCINHLSDGLNGLHPFEGTCGCSKERIDAECGG